MPPPKLTAPRRRHGVLLKAVLIIVGISLAFVVLQHSRHLCRIVPAASHAAPHASDGAVIATLAGGGNRFNSPEVQRKLLHKSCAAGCEKRGNCNFEEGRCE